MTPQPAPDDAPTEVHLDMSAARAVEHAATAQHALESLGESEFERRASLLATLAIARSLTDPVLVRGTLTEAAEAAESAGTAAAHTYVLLAQFAVDLSPEALDDRRRFATEAVELLAQVDGAAAVDALTPATYFAYLSALTESGDARALDRALSPEAHLGDPLAGMMDHRFATWFRCSRATMDGQLTLAERLAGEGYEQAIRVADVDAETIWAGQTAVIRWMQGRISEMEPVFLHARQADPGEPIWGVAVAWIWVHQGRKRAARGLLDSLPAPTRLPRGRNHLATLALLAEVVAAVGTDDENDRLAAALLPFSERVVTMGLGITSWGTVARSLALLARARGDVQTACRWYEASIELSSRMGAQPWLARAQVELARLLAEQGDAVAARELAGESAAAARSLGLRYIEQWTDRVLRHLASQSGEEHVDSGFADGGRTGAEVVAEGRAAEFASDAPADRVPADSATVDTAPADSATVEALPTGTAAMIDPALGSRMSTGSVSALPAEGASAFRPVPTFSQGDLSRPGWAHMPGPVSGMTPGTRSGPERRHTRITVLGRFAVTYPDGSRASWKSRKAALLLKVLIARRGAPLARETAMDLLWPGQDPGALANRLSVALTAVRRGLDPERQYSPNTFVTASAGTLRLNVDRLSIDVEDFLALAERARATPTAEREARESLLRDALAAYTGDALADEPYAAWAEQLREQAHVSFFAASHALAEMVAANGDHLQRVELYRSIVALDPYDMAAHDGLVDALTELGATGHVAAARRERHERMAELGLAAG